MKRSESIKELATALAKAQGAMRAAKKDSTNPFYKSQYADLASIIEAVREPFASNGLSFTQALITNDKNECGVEMLLMHSSGEWIEYDSPFFLPVSKDDAQGFGSAGSYVCRYQVRSVCGVATADDDGELARAAKPSSPKILPNAIPANVEGETIFAKMTPEEKDYLGSHVREFTKLSEAKASDLILARYFNEQRFDDEEALALSTLLSAPIRAAIKRGRAELRSQLASQP